MLGFHQAYCKQLTGWAESGTHLHAVQLCLHLLAMLDEALLQTLDPLQSPDVHCMSQVPPNIVQVPNDTISSKVSCLWRHKYDLQLYPIAQLH